MKSTLFSVGFLTLAFTACDMGSSNTMIVTPVQPGTGGGSVDPIEPAPMCDYNKTYQDFAGKRLHAGDVEEDMGLDRDRVKDYEALRGEFARVFGSTPALLTEIKNTYGLVPARWYQEPKATAISVYSSMRVAFAGCLTYTAKPDYSAAPDANTAPALCAAMEKKFWSRDPDANEIDNCVNLAVNGTTEEPDPSRRWAYTCAAVLSSADFLTF